MGNVFKQKRGRKLYLKSDFQANFNANKFKVDK